MATCQELAAQLTQKQGELATANAALSVATAFVASAQTTLTAAQATQTTWQNAVDGLLNDISEIQVEMEAMDC